MEMWLIMDIVLWTCRQVFPQEEKYVCISLPLFWVSGFNETAGGNPAEQPAGSQGSRCWQKPWAAVPLTNLPLLPGHPRDTREPSDLAVHPRCGPSLVHHVAPAHPSTPAACAVEPLEACAGSSSGDAAGS